MLGYNGRGTKRYQRRKALLSGSGELLPAGSCSIGGHAGMAPSQGAASLAHTSAGGFTTRSVGDTSLKLAFSGNPDEDFLAAILPAWHPVTVFAIL